MHSQKDDSTLLRRSLQANALFSGSSGLLFVFFGDPLAALMGISIPWLLPVVGIGLLGYAAGLLRNAARKEISRTEAWFAVAADLLWVVGSGVVVLADVLNNTGNWVVLAVADVVGLFALLQFLGLRKSARPRTA